MKLFTASCLLFFGVCCSSGGQPASNPQLDLRRTHLRQAIAARWEYRLETHPEFATYVGDVR